MNAIAETEEVVSSRDGQDAENKPRLTIRQLREAAQKESKAKETAMGNWPRGNSIKAAPPKKKPSIFGGLFQVREPTQIALNQVAAQMIAQHGSTSATKVPNVRLEKMPEFVPKVNSKWDGIPETVKQKEKKDKEKQVKRESFLFTDSTRSDGGKRSRRTNSRNSSSTTNSSFGPYNNSSGSHGASSRTRFYAQSVNSSGDLASQHRADASNFPPPSASTVSPAESSEESYPWLGPSSTITEQHLNRRNDLDVVPSKSPPTNRSLLNRTRPPDLCIADTSKLTTSLSTDPPPDSGWASSYSTADADQPVLRELDDWAAAARAYGPPSVQAVPPYSASPTKSPRNASPITPSYIESLHSPRHAINEPALLSLVSATFRTTSLNKETSQASVNDAFLAGEAQELILPDDESSHGTGSQPETSATSDQTPVDSGRSRLQQDLEKRPDSSRDRLGLRASMLWSDGGKPWEMPQRHESQPSSLRITQPVPNAKTKFHKPFSRGGK